MPTVRRHSPGVWEPIKYHRRCVIDQNPIFVSRVYECMYVMHMYVYDASRDPDVCPSSQCGCTLCEEGPGDMTNMCDG